MVDQFKAMDVIRPAALHALQDIINPFALASVLIYCLIVLVLASTRKQLFYLTGFFIFSACIFSVSELYGGFDRLVTQSGIDFVVVIFYYIVSIVFLIAGSVLFQDWKRLKRAFPEDISKIRWAWFRSLDPHISVKKNWLLLLFKVVVFVFLGFFLTLLDSFWPKSEYVYVVFSNMVANKQKSFAFATFFVYSVIAVLPYIVFWSVFRSLYRTANKESLKNRISLLLISLSGFALALSIGLLVVCTKINGTL